MFKKRVHQEKQTFNPPTKAKVYPMWTFAKVDDRYWLLLAKTKMQLVSERAFWSWGKPYVEATAKSLENYNVWKKVGFAPGSLLRGMDGQYWFVTGSKPLEQERRLITTPDMFNILGFDTNNAITVSQEELLFHQEGVSIDYV